MANESLGKTPKTETEDRQLQEALERLILHGLSCEWGSALSVLSPQDRGKMRKPLFSLKDMDKTLGYWSPHKREICLSRRLALNHRWDAVREVLVHEMAHQFAHEVLHASEEPPHGPTFQRACHLLRANPKASGQTAPLDDRLFGRQRSGNDDQTLERINKLMALAQSANRHEAESAMAKAHELMAKYNITEIERHANRRFVSAFAGTPRLRHRREDYFLARLLQDFYFVQGIWASAYVLDKGGMGRVLEISGTMQNVEVAGYVFDFVRRFIDSRWIRYNDKKRLGQRHKTDFSVGIIEGFRTKLEGRQERTLGPDQKALIRKGERQLTEYVSYRYPRTVQFKRSHATRDANVFEDGLAIGKRLVIAKGIVQRAGGDRAPLELEHKAHES